MKATLAPLGEPTSPPRLMPARAPALGAILTIGQSLIDVDHDIGDELVFGIFVEDTLDVFLMGPGSRNGDGLAHATVDSLGGGKFRVGFEDISGVVTLDYDDNVFLFEGGVITNVPEPGSLALLGQGLGLAGFFRERRRAQV